MGLPDAAWFVLTCGGIACGAMVGYARRRRRRRAWRRSCLEEQETARWGARVLAGAFAAKAPGERQALAVEVGALLQDRFAGVKDAVGRRAATHPVLAAVWDQLMAPEDIPRPAVAIRPGSTFSPVEEAWLRCVASVVQPAAVEVDADSQWLRLRATVSPGTGLGVGPAEADLGLALLRLMAEAGCGVLTVLYESAQGTLVEARIPRAA